MHSRVLILYRAVLLYVCTLTPAAEVTMRGHCFLPGHIDLLGLGLSSHVFFSFFASQIHLESRKRKEPMTKTEKVLVLKDLETQGSLTCTLKKIKDLLKAL